MDFLPFSSMKTDEKTGKNECEQICHVNGDVNNNNNFRIGDWMVE